MERCFLHVLVHTGCGQASTQENTSLRALNQAQSGTFNEGIKLKLQGKRERLLS